MEKVGVAMVVEGLSSFLGDMGKADKGIQSLIPTTGLLGSAFSALSGVFESVGNFITNVLAHALGELLADAVQWVTAKIQELISSIFELADELARLEVRLNGLNMPTGEVKDWEKAMEGAKLETQDQLKWLQALAVAAPFGPGQIASIYTATRQMGLLDDAARKLTVDVLEYAAGSGLSNEEAERVIENLRQMAARGKVTGTELRDLARGALMPLNDIFARMGKEMGITSEELQKLIRTPEGVPTDIFVRAFQEMVDEEPRFVGAMGRLGRTFEMATKNFWELIASLGAKNIVLPVFKVLGEQIATITDQFVQFKEDTGELITTAKWDAAVAAAGRVGQAIADIVSQLLGLAPSAEGIADGIVNGLNGIADWMDANKQTIVDGVVEIRNWLFGTDTQEGAISIFFGWLKDTVYPFITTVLIPKIIELKNWLFGTDKEEGAISIVLRKIYDIGVALAPVIDPLVDLLGALGEVIVIAFGGTETQTFAEFVKNTLVPAIEDWTKKINDNKDMLADLLVWIIKVTFYAQLFSMGIGVVIEIGKYLLTILGTLIVVFKILGAVWSVIQIPLILLASALNTTVVGALVAVIGMVIAVVAEFVFLKGYWISFIASAKETWNNFATYFSNLWESIKNDVRNKDWLQLGIDIVKGIWAGITFIPNLLRDAILNGVIGGYNAIMEFVGAESWKIGESISTGIASGINDNAWLTADAASQAASGAHASARNALRVKSPSKLFEELGGFTMEGLAIGIEKSAGLAVSAMASAVGKMTMPALQAPSMAYSAASSAPSGNTYSTVNNFQQTVNTSANSEPIIADFNMMASLAGV